MAIFEAKDLTYYYPNKSSPAIRDINLEIDEGEFILILGESGSGKSTLARLFNGIVPEFYGGKIAGKAECKIDAGMVFQDPEKQLVMDTVEREIAFGLENLGIEYSVMKKKVMETISFLNLWDLKDTKTYELSGGQKQKVAIGACLSMGQKLIVLDEPTSQLDPAVAEEIFSVLKKLNADIGYTIVLVEQRIDKCFNLADRIIFMKAGAIFYDGSPQNFIKCSYEQNHGFLPLICEFFASFKLSDVPKTVKEGRKLIKKLLPYTKIDSEQNIYEPLKKEYAINIEKLDFAYENGIEALKNINLRIHKGEIMGMMGENGSGKTTLFKNVCSLLKPAKGKLSVNGTIGYLSQNPNDYLFSDTLYEELKFTLDNNNIKDYGRIDKTLEKLRLDKYSKSNPRDLSGGERQRAALASILVMEPDILLFDEPTRGLDRTLKEILGELILKLKHEGKTVFVITHDVEFVAQFCDRVCLMFNGSIAQTGSKYEVLTSGLYYTSQMNRLFDGYIENILTLQDARDAFSTRLKEGAV